MSRERRLLFVLGALTAGVIVHGAVRSIAALRAPDPRAARLASVRARLDAQDRAIPWVLANTEARGKHLLLDAVADCVTSDRIGRRGDGGKWLCNPDRIRRPCVVYGVGAGAEISFEEEMAWRFGCEVHVFDPSPSVRARFGELERGRRLGEGSVTFHPWGLGPVSTDPDRARELTIEGVACEVKTLDEMAAALGHARVDVLKIDIEGGELAVLPDLLGRSLLERYGVAQLVAELHAFEPGDFEKIVRIILGLGGHGYLLHRKELNPYDATRCAEYAFAREDLVLQ